MDGTILVADDDRTIRTVLTQALTRAGCKVHATSSLTTLMRWVEEGRGDLVITDVMMPDGNGIELIPKIGQERPGLPVIVISAQNTIMTAIQANEADAWDYLPKPFDLPDLMKRVGRAIQQRPSQQRSAPAAPPPRDAADNDLPLVGRTPAMQALYGLIARVLNSDMPALITGESGTGKSLVARTLHDLSDRRALPFVVASAEDLRAHDDALAVLARARNGTLVLDELSDYDADAQARLARLLDTVMERSGPRILAASQADLAARLASGSLREDLFYRISGVTLKLPALRERLDDLPLLADHFLSRAATGAGNAPRTLSPEALELARTYTWPGNLRQLDNVMRRLQLTGQERVIARAEVEAVLHNQPAMEPLRSGCSGEKLSDSVAAHLRRYFDMHGVELPPPGLHGRILREVEAPLIEIALDATSGNQARCADLLGINRNTLRKKILDLDIRVTRRRKLM